MWLHPQRLIQGSHLCDRTAPRTTANAAWPRERPQEAGHRAWSKTLAPPQGPAGWAGGPKSRLASPLGEHGFDQMPPEDTDDLPRGQDQGGEGRGVFHRTQQPLQRRIIIAYAVG